MVLLMIIPTGLAYNSGDSICITIDNCKDWVDLHVEGNLEIDQYEYWFDDCFSIDENYWRCYCNAPAISITMHTSARTLNSYNITASYELADPPSSQSSSSGRRRGIVYIINQTEGECEVCDEPAPPQKIINDDEIKPENQSVEVTAPVVGLTENTNQVPLLKLPTYFWTVIFILVIATIISYIYFEVKKGKDEKG